MDVCVSVFACQSVSLSAYFLPVFPTLPVSACAVCGEDPPSMQSRDTGGLGVVLLFAILDQEKQEPHQAA